MKNKNIIKKHNINIFYLKKIIIKQSFLTYKIHLSISVSNIIYLKLLIFS